MGRRIQIIINGGRYTDQFELRTCRRQLLGSTSCNSGTNYFYIVTDHTARRVKCVVSFIKDLKNIKEKGLKKKLF
jgi:hypothetical protein